MSTNSHEVFANSTTPLFLQSPAQAITLSPTSGAGNVVLTNSNSVFLVNGQPTGTPSDWSVYPATSNLIKMDNLGNNITNDGNNLYYNGNLIANSSDIQNISDWSLYNAISDLDLTETGFPTLARGGVITTSGGFRTHTFASALTESFDDYAITDYAFTPVWNGWTWAGTSLGGGGIAKTGGAINGATTGAPPYFAFLMSFASPYTGSAISPTILIPQGTTMTLTFKYSYKLSSPVPNFFSVTYDGTEIFATTTFSATDWLTATATFTATTPSGQFVFTQGNGTDVGDRNVLFSGISLMENFRVVSSSNLAVTSLVVGGGGGGGNNCGGGGGAGGVSSNSSTLTAGGVYPVVVGSGGSGGYAGSSGNGVVGNNGGNSTFNSITGLGGGGGGSPTTTPNGIAGGCGGGGSQGGNGASNTQTGGTAGGNGLPNGGLNVAGGGGGGMGTAGSNAILPNNAGNGGNGATYTIGGTSYLIAGGGGGGSYSPYGGVAGAGGTGGGGAGQASASSSGFNATNYGSGGGGSGGGGGALKGGNGFQGIVIISYPVTASTQNYKILGAGNITSVGVVSAGSVASSGAVSGTTGTFTTLVVPSVSNSGNLSMSASSNLSLSATSNATLTASNVLTTTAPQTSNTFTSQYKILGDRGADLTDFCYTTLSNKGGKGGQINLVADAGSVEIGGVTFSVGGLINITANSALSAPFNATSAVKISAAGVNIYAGAFPPELAPLGQLYLWGQTGNSLVSSLAPVGFNAETLTNYIYATDGTRIDGVTRIKELKNYTGFNLNIHPDSGQACDITRVQYIGLGSASNTNLPYPVIKGTGNASLFGFSNLSSSNIDATTYTGTNLNGFSSLTNSQGGSGGGVGDLTLTAFKTTSGVITPIDTFRNITLNASCNINLNTSNGGQVLINGSAIDGVGTWATYPASQNVDFSNFAISNLASINSVAFSNIVRTPMTKDLDASDFALNNVALLSGDSNFYITKDTANPLYIRNINFGGSIELVGGSNASSIVVGQSNLDLVANASTLSLQGQANITMKSPINMSNHAISNVPTISNSAGTLTLQGTEVLIPATLNMSNNAIINVPTISNSSTLTLAGTSITASAPLNMTSNILYNVGNIAGGNVLMRSTGDLRLFANESNTSPTAGAYMYVGVLPTPYHTISMQQGQALFIASSNSVSIGGLSNYLTTPTIVTSTFSRQMSSSNVAQPIIQYGTFTGSGSSGSGVVTIPTAYAGSGTYVVQVTMLDPPTAQLYATPQTGNTFNIGWSSGGGGVQRIMWTTFGT